MRMYCIRTSAGAILRIYMWRMLSAGLYGAGHVYVGIFLCASAFFILTKQFIHEESGKMFLFSICDKIRAGVLIRILENIMKFCHI